MSQQKALFLDGVNSDFVIRPTKIYKPAPGELLVQLKAASLNPADWKLQRYEATFLQYPIICGLDMAGDVTEVGEGVEGFSVGDRVFFQGSFVPRNMGFQEYATVPAIRTAKIPASMSYDQAASIPLVLFTSWSGFYNSTQGFGFPVPTAINFESTKGQYANTPMVILGGASSVGQMAIQLAKLSGFSPIITTASLKNERLLKSFGATHVIDRHIPLSSLPSEVAKITSEKITFVYDAVTYPETAQAGYDLLANDGKLVLVSPEVNVNEEKGTGKKVIKCIAYVLAPPENVQLVNDLYANLTRLLESGVIVPNKVEALPNGLRGIADGLRRLENDQVSAAKLVAHPHETD